MNLSAIPEFTRNLPPGSSIIQDCYHAWPQVVLAYLLACLAAGTALSMLDRVVSADRGKGRPLWTIPGGISLGAGIWAMHFTAMTAFRAPFSIRYDTSLTLASLLVAIAFCTLGMALYSTRQSLHRSLLSSLLIASGIVCMHYIGMSAMHMPAKIYYAPLSVLLAFIVAILTSLAALLLARHFLWRQTRHYFFKRCLCSAVMGLAIVSTHFTAMEGAVLVDSAPPPATETMLQASTEITLIIAATCIFIMLLGIVAGESHRRLQFNKYRLRKANALVTKLETAQQKLEEVALRDSVTHLHNRHALNLELERIIERHKRHGSNFALLFIDLDNFKRVNDSLGHSYGDALLLGVADRLHGCLRGQDLIARFGGDEFIIILEEDQLPRINAIIDRLLKEIKSPFLLEEHSITASISIGVAIYPAHGRNGTELLHNADIALYQAKARGKHRAAIFNTQMHVEANRHLALEHELHDAIEQGNIATRFQPIIDATTRKVIALESLASWYCQGEQVSSGEFTKLAENTGLIVPICEQVLMKTLQMLTTLSATGHDHIRLLIRLSPLQLQDYGLSKHIEALLREADINRQNLILVFTKQCIVDNLEFASRQLARLKSLGVGIAMDGFDTGYSVISHMKNLPIDYIKLDQSLVSALPDAPKDEVIMEAILAMTHKLKLTTIAEGVKTHEQADFFTRNHCGLLQGPFFSPPLPENQLIHFLQENRRSSSIPDMSCSA